MESKISDTFLQIGDRLVGLKVYRHIYNEDHELDQELQSKTVLAYDSFISFSMEAIKYYSMGAKSEFSYLFFKFDNVSLRP